MRLALLSQLADWIRGSWRALGLADNAGGEDHERREQCLAEINAIWNFTVATQLFAIATLAAANYLGNQSSLNIETGLRAAVVLPFAVLVLATLKLRTCKSWEPHVRNRLVVCAAAGMGAGLLWLLWLASRLDAGPEQIAGFVAIFGAIAATLGESVATDARNAAPNSAPTIRSGAPPFHQASPATSRSMPANVYPG